MDSLNANYPKSLKYVDNNFNTKNKSDKAFSGYKIFESECFIKDSNNFDNISSIQSNEIINSNIIKKPLNKSSDKKKEENAIENFSSKCEYYKNNYYRYYSHFQRGNTGKPNWHKDYGAYHGGKDNKYAGDWRDKDNCAGWKKGIAEFKRLIELIKKEIEKIKKLYYELNNKHNILQKKYSNVLKKIGIEVNYNVELKVPQNKKTFNDNNRKEITIEPFWRRKKRRKKGLFASLFDSKPAVPPCNEFKIEYNKLKPELEKWKKILEYWKKLYRELFNKHTILKKKYKNIINKINLEVNFKVNKLGNMKKKIFDDNNQMNNSYHMENFSNYITDNSIDQIIEYNKELSKKQELQKDKIELIKEKELNLQKVNALLKSSNDRNSFKKKIILTLVALIFLLFILSISTYIYFIRDFKPPAK